MSYEFNDADANVLKNLGNKFVVLGSIMIVTGVMTVTSYLLSGDIFATKKMSEAVNFVILLISGIILYRPSDNLINIATTEGRDIQELMQAIKEFSFAFLVTGLLFLIVAFMLLLEMLIQ